MPTVISALLAGGAKSWGVSDEEKSYPFAVDRLGLAGEPLYRGITIHASPATVFRWLLQIKVAPYSYDLLDNLGRQSPRQLTPGLEALEPGQTFMFIFDLAEFEKDKSLTLRIKPALRLGGLGGDTALSYDIRPAENGSVRLLVKIVVRYAWGPLGWPVRLLLPPGDLIMMRKQLLTIKELAEESEKRDGKG